MTTSPTKFSFVAYMDYVLACISIFLLAWIIGWYMTGTKDILADANVALTVSQNDDQIVSYNIKDAEKIDFRGLIR